jgi:hypothetical protein
MVKYRIEQVFGIVGFVIQGFGMNFVTTNYGVLLKVVVISCPVFRLHREKKVKFDSDLPKGSRATYGSPRKTGCFYNASPFFSNR